MFANWLAFSPFLSSLAFLKWEQKRVLGGFRETLQWFWGLIGGEVKSSVH